MLNVQPSGLGVSERSAHGTTDAISSTACTTTAVAQSDIGDIASLNVIGMLRGKGRAIFKCAKLSPAT